MSLPGQNEEAFIQQRYLVSRDVAIAISATSTLALGTLLHAFRVERAELVLDTTFAADPANYWVFTLQHGATVIATWSTQTTGQGAITGGTPAAMVLAAESLQNRIIGGQSGDTLQLVATKNGTAANVPQLRVSVQGREVQF